MIIRGTNSIVGILSLESQNPRKKTRASLNLRRGESFSVETLDFDGCPAIKDAIALGFVEVLYENEDVLPKTEVQSEIGENLSFSIALSCLNF